MTEWGVWRAARFTEVLREKVRVERKMDQLVVHVCKKGAWW